MFGMMRREIKSSAIVDSFLVEPRLGSVVGSWELGTHNLFTLNAKEKGCFQKNLVH